MCSDNRDNNGRTVLCASFVYDHATFMCTIYRAKSYPEGDLKTEIAPGKRFFEKFCLGEDVPADCADSQFLKAEQSVIIGYAKNVSIATSIEECIAQCLAEHFQCKSAMYFYNEGECITNAESAMTQPTSFAHEESDKVIYIQNGCPAVLAQQKQLESSIRSATELVLTTADEDVTDETEEISTTIPTAEDNGDNKKEGVTNTAATAMKNSTAEERLLKQENDSEEHVDEGSSEERGGSSFRTDPTEPSVPEETMTTNIVGKISNVLKRKFKKLRAESGIANFRNHPKLLKKKKLQLTRNLASEEEENKSEESTPLEVKPSPFQIESQHADKRNSTMIFNEKLKAGGLTQKPIKRLKIETLSGSEEEDHFSQWSNWSPCRKASERRIRRRKCYNLRKCVGALMEVEECPKTVERSEPEYRAIPDDNGPRAASKEGPIAPPGVWYDKPDLEDGAPPAILPGSQQPHLGSEFAEREEIWSPWPGICQEFASGQPCKNHEIIGFESRDCLATDNTKCKGPFFRYCTIPC